MKSFLVGLLKSVAFLTTYGMWMKLFMCYGRNLTKGYFTPMHTVFINTLGGSFSFMLEDKSRRSEICIVIFHRVLESFETFLAKRKLKFADSKFFLPMMFAVSIGIISDYYAKEKANMKVSFQKLFSLLLGNEQDYCLRVEKEDSTSTIMEVAKSIGDKIEDLESSFEAKPKTDLDNRTIESGENLTHA